MQRINESSELDEQPADFRKLLVAIDDSDECDRALSWTLEHLYRTGDEIHLLHVIPRLQRSSSFGGAPPVDFLPQQDPVGHEKLIKRAEAFIRSRYLPRLTDVKPEATVHIIKSDVDTESIGNVVCRKAEDIGARALIISSRSVSRLKRFFLGSVTSHCVHHSKVPVMVVH